MTPYCINSVHCCLLRTLKEDLINAVASEAVAIFVIFYSIVHFCAAATTEG